MSNDVVQAIDVDERHVECPLCHTRTRLPLNDWPVLCEEGEVWLPTLVAVRCETCRAELRLREPR